jgi:heptosyltransferase-2
MKTILVVKFGALGDVVRTSFILEGLYKKYPLAKIYWLTSDKSFELLRFNPFIDHLITPSLNIEILNGICFDLIISLDDEIEILRLVSSIKHKKIVGAFLDLYGNPIYDEQSSLWFDMGLISKYGKRKADILKKKNKLTHKQIMEAILNIKIYRPFFFNSSIIENKMGKLFDKSFFNIGLNSGAGERWISKQLPLNETTKLIKKLLIQKVADKKTIIYLLGGENEQKRHKIILNEIRNKNLRDIGSKNSLLEFAAIIKHLDYVISSDSLALHLAISQKIPNLSFFAPTSANEIETFGTGVKVRSLSADYCSYKADADNSTLTAERIFEVFKSHIEAITTPAKKKRS